ncbi:MAG: AsnC family transcriptional regulator, partial [Acidimicrobiaceae bacterium]|nr:AsnC family transcriptional regulator [Acidimicrobiaceae bacterium]
MDTIDELILRHLTRDGRATHRELGQAAGLSPNAAGARLARLVER